MNCRKPCSKVRINSKMALSKTDKRPTSKYFELVQFTHIYTYTHTRTNITPFTHAHSLTYTNMSLILCTLSAIYCNCNICEERGARSHRISLVWFCHFFLMRCTIHSKPWYNLQLQGNWKCQQIGNISKHFLFNYPSPVRAQHAWMCHWCFLMLVKSNCLEISAADIEPFKS